MPRRSDVPDPREYNRLTTEEFRANHGQVTGDFEGRSILLLSTTGAKSGHERVTPLIYADYGDRLIVTAAAGGQPKNPGWYHNIVANPTVAVEVGDDRFTVEAIVTTGEDRAAIFAERCASSPAFNDYQQKADREIPIIALPRPKSA
jgi:deazaflavin-dependent oxidoreductase (nitroreductase family)